MKKILLIAGVTGFITATAQEPGFFDIQKHLEKKSKNSFRPLLRKPTQMFPSTPKLSESLKPDRLATLSHSLPNGNPVYLLPQDNMPCIVPDMNQFNMLSEKKINPYLNPFSENNHVPDRIPNLIIPFKIIPGNKE